jgi:sulfopyruvate decarboxylase TPP-binding subunit
MIESDAFVQALQDIGVDFFTGVPESTLGGIIAELMERRLYTPAVREDEAVAMAAGAYMYGKVPFVLHRTRTGTSSTPSFH